MGRRSGWLELTHLTGKAVYERARVRRKAWIGMRLRRAGEIFETGKGTNATFQLDQGLGTVEVFESTHFRIKALYQTSSGGRVTQLSVEQGQVRLKVRPMTNPSSRLEILTPVGINGVRGTEFGISVQPSGKAGIVTRSGLVYTSAKGETVEIEKGFQTLTMPGESPLPPKPFKDDPNVFSTRSQIEGDRVRLTGKTDAVNLIFLNGLLQDTDREGNFNYSFPIGDATFVVMRVLTPLGRRKDHWLPLY